jgi:hypothetical protein
MPLGLVRMMKKLPAIPVVPNIFKSVESVFPKFLPRISDVIPG